MNLFISSAILYNIQRIFEEFVFYIQSLIQSIVQYADRQFVLFTTTN